MHLSTVETVLAYDVREPSHLRFSIEAARWPTQAIVGEELTVWPALPRQAFEDARSGTRLFRIDVPPGPLQVRYKADVEVRAAPPPDDLREVPVGELPDEILPFLMPSRYCESDLLAAFARQRFAALPPGLARVRHVVDWVHEHVAYQPGSTTSTTTAQQALAQRAGVCRDFAHIAIALCRALNIPARLVAGYAWFDEPPQDFHAVFEAWVGGRWVMFDPTRMARMDRLVRIATGHDAKDVAFCTIFGNVAMTAKEVSVLEHGTRSPVTAEAVTA